MHNTYLLNKISKGLRETCEKHRIKKINQFVLAISHHSHITKESLLEHLRLYDSQIIGDELDIKIRREDLEEQTAIIYSIQGEKLGM